MNRIDVSTVDIVDRHAYDSDCRDYDHDERHGYDDSWMPPKLCESCNVELIGDENQIDDSDLCIECEREERINIKCAMRDLD